MSRFVKRFQELLGYSRGERRASVILLLLILLVLIIRFFNSGQEAGIDIVSPYILTREQALKTNNQISTDSMVLFPFDPNTVSSESLKLLGMSSLQTRTLINYRTKGGRFRKAEDLNKVYGIDSALGSRLIPYINIKGDAGKKSKKLVRDSMSKLTWKKAIKPKANLNRCDSADLEQLPLIGPVLSARIVRYRDLLGGFYSVAQLGEVYGLSDSVLQVISEKVFTDSAEIKYININHASFKDLVKHPYLERYEVQAILKYRSIKGRIDSMGELVENKIMLPSRAARVKPYFLFRDNPDSILTCPEDSRRNNEF